MKNYTYLIIWITGILLITYLINLWFYWYPIYSMMTMNLLMAIWFMVFWILKLVDLSWFALKFSQYDPLAQKFMIYWYIFPFLEIFVWLIYLRDTYMQHWILSNGLALLMTWITSFGILRILFQKKRNVCCACMGTKLLTPLWRPSFLEQITMFLMAWWMLLMMRSMM